MKTEEQKISESILLLKVLQEDDNIFGATKLQKQVFLNELKLIDIDSGGLYYKYFRYNYGPFSRQLQDNYNALADKGFIHKTTYRLTDRGEYLIGFVEGCIVHYRDNGKIFETVKATTNKYRKYTGKQLMDLVYDMAIVPVELPDRRMKIKDIPMFIDLLWPERDKVEHKLTFPRHILDDIKAELAMDKDTWDNLEQTQADAVRKATRSLSAALSADPL
jgi:uncharacterized protein YwgA